MNVFQDMNLKSRELLRSGQYIPFNKRLRTCKSLSECERRVLEALLYACGRGGEIYPKITTLMDWTNYSRPHVSRGIQLLETRQILRVDRTSRRNRYYINFAQLENVLTARRRKQYRPFAAVPQLESDVSAKDAEPATRRKTKYVRQDADMMRQMFAMTCYLFSRQNVSELAVGNVSKVSVSSFLDTKNEEDTKNVLLREPEERPYLSGADAPDRIGTDSSRLFPLEQMEGRGSAVDTGEFGITGESEIRENESSVSATEIILGESWGKNGAAAPFLDRAALMHIANSVCVSGRMPEAMESQSLCPVVPVECPSDSEVLAQAIDRTLGKAEGSSEKENRSEGKLEGGTESTQGAASESLSRRDLIRPVGSESRVEGSVTHDQDPTEGLPFSKSSQVKRREPKEPKGRKVRKVRKEPRSQVQAKRVIEHFNRVLTNLGHGVQKTDAVTRAALLLMIKDIGEANSCAVVEYMATHWELCCERDQHLQDHPNLYNITAKWRYPYWLKNMHVQEKKKPNQAKEPAATLRLDQKPLEDRLKAVKEKKAKDAAVQPDTQGEVDTSN